MTRREKPRGYLQSAAYLCTRLPGTRDGKEGVDGSSPSEGFAKTRKEPLAEYETRSAPGVESVTPSACPQGMIECGVKKLDRSAVALFYEPFSSSSSSGRRRKGA
jgi:hypothetical protein